MDQSSLEIRLATNRDCEGIIALIDRVFGEYNDSVCLEDAEADLLDIQQSYFDAGGAFWVLAARDKNENERILGTHGAMPGGESDNACHFRRLYLDKQLRGSDWGHRLMQVTIDWAKAKGFSRVEFWSDTRFDRAHKFFSKFGFKRDGRQREMRDSHEVYHEYFFYLEL
jgi:GNAT superfamily N-acetyltransferase